MVAHARARSCRAFVPPTVTVVDIEPIRALDAPSPNFSQREAERDDALAEDESAERVRERGQRHRGGRERDDRFAAGGQLRRSSSPFD